MTGTEWGVVVVVLIGLLVLRGTARQLFFLGAVAVILARLTYLAVA